MHSGTWRLALVLVAGVAWGANSAAQDADKAAADALTEMKDVAKEAKDAIRKIASSGEDFSTAGDFDEDGRLDLAVADAGGSFVSLLFGRADGTLAANRSIATGSAPWSLAVADFDRDGVEDVVVRYQK